MTIPQRPVVDTDLAWAAGFFDGEGCVGMYRSSKKYLNYRLIVTVAQVSLEPINRFFWTVGIIGNVYHADPRGPKERGAWIWQAGGPRAADVLAMLYPFLVGKREQAAFALECQAQWNRPGQKMTPEQRQQRVEWAATLAEMKR